MQWQFVKINSQYLNHVSSNTVSIFFGPAVIVICSFFNNAGPVVRSSKVRKEARVNAAGTQSLPSTGAGVGL